MGEGRGGREDHSPEGLLLLDTDEEKNIIIILFLDSVLCFMVFVFTGEKNNGCKYL